MSESIVHPMIEKKKTFFPIVTLFGGVVIIFLGITSGYLLAKPKSLTDGLESQKTLQVIGTRDKETFRDSAEGILEVGGINGEGTHKLIRPGGESQTVYLTSSVVDLNQFVGKKVRVWGETFAAQKAGWLMDIGLIELFE